MWSLVWTLVWGRGHWALSSPGDLRWPIESRKFAVPRADHAAPRHRERADSTGAPDKTWAAPVRSFKLRDFAVMVYVGFLNNGDDAWYDAVNKRAYVSGGGGAIRRE
jgi:hypothetical protein